MTIDEKYIRRAMELARAAARDGNEPFGAVLVRDGVIIAEGKNQIYTQYDPTYHAELGLIRDYCTASRVTDLGDCTLYASCEPCFMCSGAIVRAKVKRLVFSAYDRDYCAIRNLTPNDCSKLIFDLSTYAPEVLGGVLHEEGVQIMKDYFAAK